LIRFRNDLPERVTEPALPVMVTLALSLRPDASSDPETRISVIVPTDTPVPARCHASISSLVYSRDQLA
jgi:hypothetical protein